MPRGQRIVPGQDEVDVDASGVLLGSELTPQARGAVAWVKTKLRDEFRMFPCGIFRGAGLPHLEVARPHPLH